MSDIVDDLREDAVRVWCSDPEVTTYEDWQDLCRHAADEIERLRAELADLRERSLDVFGAMADLARGNRQFKPNPKTERFIQRQLERLMSVQEISSVLGGKAHRHQAKAMGKSLKWVFSQEFVEPKDLEENDE